MVFVTQDASETCNPEFDALAAMLGNDWKLFTTSEQEFAANWKIVAEGFLEGYHIRSTHHDTFYPIQYDNLNVIEAFGQSIEAELKIENIVTGAAPGVPSLLSLAVTAGLDKKNTLQSTDYLLRVARPLGTSPRERRVGAGMSA
jgi:hypothetical protein